MASKELVSIKTSSEGWIQSQWMAASRSKMAPSLRRVSALQVLVALMEL